MRAERSVLTRDPVTPMWVGTAGLRVLTYLFALAAVIVHHDDYARPTLGWIVLGAMTVWTVFATAANLAEWGRRPIGAIADVLVTSVLVASSAWILTPAQHAAITPLVTTVWASVPPVAAGVVGGRVAGVAGGLVVAVANGIARQAINTDVVRDAVLLIAAGLLIGMASTAVRRSDERLRLALRAEAATAERERLARSIHDSVLQVLARVRRRGSEVGGEAGEIGRLAGEQEVALRSLVSTTAPESNADGTSDVRPHLQMLASGRVQVSAPATPVMLPAPVVVELAWLVREALENVHKHAGPSARAWVLLEDVGDEVVVSVRDDGVGIAPGRLDAAAQQGRMGVARSIRGRVDDLGGTITLETAPDAGTEWEVRLPRAAEPVPTRWRALMNRLTRRDGGARA
ncbi:signal transduction histidine kinase [Herbihabitans rhizosphaerae]|uniref:Signal transduction histidine kinase n=1 Tax=Herbihabitans rhizosphaerae TaxID=1872711 RepID=A0A4Q7KNW1_9PSEU|nr:DUF5931 domain-containing protein [Herbihabitans rhizosphaerae]RZS37660.1 signal transduction histidine kinase [Herbihabitans rhizosphaerae]